MEPHAKKTTLKDVADPAPENQLVTPGFTVGEDATDKVNNTSPVGITANPMGHPPMGSSYRWSPLR